MPLEIRKRPLPVELESLIAATVSPARNSARPPGRLSSLNRCALLATAVGSLVMLLGCGGEEKTTLYPVTITVTYPDKKPAPGAQVVLHSLEHNTTSRGVTGEDGSCQLTTLQANDGASPGPHEVLVAEPPLMGDPDVPSKGPQIADRFARFNTSGLKVDVKSDGSENIAPGHAALNVALRRPRSLREQSSRLVQGPGPANRRPLGQFVHNGLQAAPRLLLIGQRNVANATGARLE
jgi:hypothetical protein